MVIKSERIIEMKDEKGKVIFSTNHRQSKAIKIFLQKALEEKWVAKDDIFWIIKSTNQSKNIWEYLSLKQKLEAEENEESKNTN